MKSTSILISIFLFLSIYIQSQTVIGKLVDENGEGLSSVFLQLYINPDIYNTTSLSDGVFFFDILTNVEEEQLPTGYVVSNNFPNPFNPTTRIIITLPNRGNVKVDIYNTLGEIVTNEIERNFNEGTNYIDIELDGLPNGFYISRITINNKYTVVKKLMLIYGSQHLTTTGGLINTPLYKSNNTYFGTNIDSLVAASSIIGRKTFTNLPSIIGDTLDLGNLTIERFCPAMPTVVYEGKTYNTVQIGSQCWLKENLDVGIMINGISNQTDNDTIEKYCYNDDPNNCMIYGGLYQWDEAMQYVTNEGAQGICPPGWLIPTLSEFYTLVETVGGYTGGNKLKAIGQGFGGGAGTNISGFSVLLAGGRSIHGTFLDINKYGWLWSSRETIPSKANLLFLNDYNSSIYIGHIEKLAGRSLRCIKD